MEPLVLVDDELQPQKFAETGVNHADKLVLKSWQKVEPVGLCWKNLRVEIPGPDKNTKRIILQQVCGYVPPGKMYAILGASGSGKTTLLRVLSGTQPVTSGEVYYNGRLKKNEPGDNDIMGFGGNAAFVTQESLLLGALTVRETLYYAAKLKCPPDIDAHERVEHIIDYLGLKSCAETKIGTVFFKGVSGGEKRRVAIGVELVSQPALLFFDEITSGLDATSAYTVIQICHKLTELGHTIVITLHQPSSRIFDMLCQWNDYLCILEHGKLMYSGIAKESVSYFNNIGYPMPEYTNPTDFFLDLVNSDFQESTTNAEKIHERLQKEVLPYIVQTIGIVNQEGEKRSLVTLPRNTFLIQLSVLLQRNFLNHLRNPAVYGIRIAMYTGLCFCLGTLYWKIGSTDSSLNDRISILFFVAAFLTFMSISGMPAFVEERHVFIRERMNHHYDTLAYSVANFLSSLPWIFLISLISTILIYSMIQARLGGDYFGIYLANLFIALLVSESMMVAISSVSPVFMVGLAAGGGLLGIYMIVCGFFLTPQHIPAGWLWVHYAISFHTYSFQTFMYNQFHDFSTVDRYGTSGIDGASVLRSYQMEHVDVGLNFLWLLIMIFVYRLLFYIFLRHYNRVLK